MPYNDYPIRTLTIPQDASTTGARIVMDGDTGVFSDYDSAGNEYVRIDETGIQVTAPPGSSGYVRLERDPTTPDDIIIVMVPSGWPETGGREGQIWASGGNEPYENDTLIMDSPSHGGRDWARLSLRSSDLIGNPTSIIHSADSVLFERAEGSVGTGVVIDLQQDGTGGIYATRNGSVKDWFDLTLMNGWTNRGGLGAKLSVRLVASPPNSMEIVGHIAPGTTTSGVQVAQLPEEYWPVSEQIILARKGSNTFPATVAIEPDGKVLIFDGPAAGGLLQMSPTTVSLDK